MSYIFKSWDPHDIEELVRLMRKFAAAIKDGSDGS
jgi:hypothetical protein